MRPRLTFSNVISVIALFVALGGGAYAAVKLKPNQVKSKNIAPDAVQGIDANESSFGTVPRAAQADQATNAANATNAASLEGLGPNDFQLGDGGDGALADFIDDGDTQGIAFFDGAVAVDCDATPQLLYVDAPGDSFATDVWVDGTHSEVPDGGTLTPVDLDPTGDTSRVHVWGALIADVVASAVWDAGATQCRAAFIVQQNQNLLNSTASASARAKRGLSRGALPEGWAEPKPWP